MGSQPEKNVRLGTACTECQRRKQKCSREWPCNHCQARRIAHQCKFPPRRVLKVAKPAASDTRASDATREKNAVEFGHSPLEDPDSLGVSHDDDFRVLGYLPDKYGLPEDETSCDQSIAISSEPHQSFSPEMENALRAIPPRPYTDMLVQHFLDDTYHQYYCLYPPTFLQDYSAWWTGKTNGQAPTPEFTCLLLRVCACSAVFLDAHGRQKLLSELGESAEKLSERFHRAARQLSSTIRPGKGGLTHVQQLFLTAFWFKTEALFVESWHALSAAIHEAQELGMHKGSQKAKVSEFHQEMRRRLWCILYVWDWQMSLLLSRPFIINSNYCSFETPSLRLESPGSEEEMPYPTVHMALQCQLGQMVSRIPGAMGGVLSPTQAISVQQETEKWFSSLPTAYSLIHPNTKWDSSHGYVPMQRHQLHAIGYVVMLMPLKQCFTQNVDPGISNIAKSLQPMAVDCALKLMESSHALFTRMVPMHAKSHFAPFLMFDTGAFLCSAIIHDSNRSLPRREEAIVAIGLALDTLEQISSGTKTGAICYHILAKVVTKLSLSPSECILMKSKSPGALPGAPRTPESQGSLNSFSHGTSMGNTDYSSDVTQDGTNAFMQDFPQPEIMGNDTLDLADFINMDVGEFGQIWDWENLGLNFAEHNQPLEFHSPVGPGFDAA